jgi:ABC-2 type transport system ATP-binding protein
VSPAIEVRGVSKAYGPVQALSAIDLEVNQGEFFALLGPNGAGKTTLISLIAGLARADKGTVRVMGHDVVADYRQARRSLGVVPQELVFDPFFSVRETLRLQSGYYGLRHNDDWIDEILDRLDLTSKADANMRSLSGGMKRRVLVAQALVHKPPVIILDEPTAGVDVDLRQGLWEFIRKLNGDGHTIVLTTHYLEEAESLCRNIAIIDEGRIVENDRMSTVLRKLHTEIFVLNLRDPLEKAPTLPSYRIKAPDDRTLEVEVNKEQNLNEVFAELTALGIEVLSMRNKTNRLEELFMRLVDGREAGNVPAAMTDRP